MLEACFEGWNVPYALTGGMTGSCGREVNGIDGAWGRDELDAIRCALEGTGRAVVMAATFCSTVCSCWHVRFRMEVFG